jgi:hypothetical protein
MRKEYDLKTLKVKHCGILTGLNPEIPAKVRVTLSLDMEIIEYFKLQAEQKGSSDYLKQINLALKNLVAG